VRVGCPYGGGIATFDDVAALALRLPEVAEGTSHHRRTWEVRGKGFAWERPLSKADLKRLGGDPAPEGPLLGLRTEDLHEKQALLAEGRPGFFTIAHFDNYPAVLVQLDVVTLEVLQSALVGAWLACAPAPLARAFLADDPS
jgi:hypothetical protein